MPEERANRILNETREVNSQCKIVVYPWKSTALSASGGTSENKLSESFRIDVSSQVLSASFSKNMGNPSGTFSFILSNSANVQDPSDTFLLSSNDWKNILQRGTWCVIYMSQDGDLVTTNTARTPDSQSPNNAEAKKIRCIGYIDRVAVKSQVDDRGAFDITYEVSGRDFGVVYEDATIWTNIFEVEKTTLEAQANSVLNNVGTATIDEVLDTIHDLFYVPGKLKGAGSNLVAVGQQWLLPASMVKDIGLPSDSSPFWGELGELGVRSVENSVKNFSKTSASIGVASPVDYLVGNAWTNLKRLSVPQFHELFTETTDNGIPKLNFRLMPFGINNRRYPTLAKNVILFKNLPSVEIPSTSLLNLDIGEDNHGRFNSFLVTLGSTSISSNSNVDVLKNSGFPFHNRDSIKRHGFRPQHVEIDSLVRNGEKLDGSPDLALLREFNHLLFDFWNNLVFFESGSAEIIGSNEIKVGKALRFDDKTPYSAGKRYYIEAYTDNFVVDERGNSMWTQTVFLTRGAEERDLRDLNLFGFRDDTNPFTNSGEFTPE